MGNVRFCSDPHFYHENMAKRRGFKDANEMNEHIIKCWNSVVNTKDVTYILGDITMEKANYEILNRLKGVKHIILGNHDEGQHTKILQEYVNKIAGSIYYKNNFILTHIPVHNCELDYRFGYNIHGHVHENTLDDPRYINVSMEVIDYTPKLLTELIKTNEREKI